MCERDVSILLVEDDDVAAEAVRRSLARNGVTYPLVWVEDGRTALEVLKAQWVLLSEPCQQEFTEQMVEAVCRLRIPDRRYEEALGFQLLQHSSAIPLAPQDHVAGRGIHFRKDRRLQKEGPEILGLLLENLFG